MLTRTCKARAVKTYCQNSLHPSDALLMKTAAKGMSTINERYVSVTPIESPKPGSTLRAAAMTFGSQSAVPTR